MGFDQAVRHRGDRGGTHGSPALSGRALQECAISTNAFEGPKWSTSLITWSFAPAGADFGNAVTGAYQAIIRSAIARWGQVANLSFLESPDGPAVDIRIGWSAVAGSEIGETVYSYVSDPKQALVFRPGTLVRLEDPSATPLGTGLKALYQGTVTTLYQIALHELGHALGLAHSGNPADVMYAELGPADPDLSAADIRGIQQLYGSPSSGTAPTGSSPTGVVPSDIALSATAPAITQGTVAATAEVLPVYRFFDTLHGTQLLTASTAERDAIVASRPDLAYEGVGMGAAAAIDPAAIPVFRFFDTSTGTHFFTSSQSEKTMLATARPDFVPEPTNLYEHATAQTGDVPVYRFFHQTDGTHFYTGSSAERAAIVSNRPDMTFEGIAFYSPAV